MTNPMDFEAWFKRTGISEDYQKMLERAFNAGRAQAMNYYADNEEEPSRITFHGGRTVQVMKGTDGSACLAVSQRDGSK